MDKTTAIKICKIDLRKKIPFGIHPELDRYRRGMERWEKYVEANDGRPYRNSYACRLEKMLSDVLVQADKIVNPPPPPPDDGMNCVGGNCCWSRGFRCHHPKTGKINCSLLY